MATLSDATLKGSATIQFIKSNTGSGVNNPPQSIKFEYNVRSRIENQVLEIATNASVVVTISNEKMTRTNLLRIASLTAGKKFNIKFNGELTGVDYEPADSTDFAFYLGSCNVTSFEITNPSANATSIAIEYSIAQYQAP